MTDDFSQPYGHLLAGSYDRVDRIVLSACHPLGHNRGGVRTWRRRLHDGCEESLDNAHLQRMAGQSQPDCVAGIMPACPDARSAG